MALMITANTCRQQAVMGAAMACAVVSERAHRVGNTLAGRFGGGSGGALAGTLAHTFQGWFVSERPVRRRIRTGSRARTRTLRLALVALVGWLVVLVAGMYGLSDTPAPGAARRGVPAESASATDPDPVRLVVQGGR